MATSLALMKLPPFSAQIALSHVPLCMAVSYHRGQMSYWGFKKKFHLHKFLGHVADLLPFPPVDFNGDTVQYHGCINMCFCHFFQMWPWT